MRVIAIALLIFGAARAQAGERCLPSDTPRQCVQRLITARAWDTAQATLADSNTGTSTVASPVRSAVKDFLAAASAHVEGSSAKDSGTALVIGYNYMKQVNLEATFPDPKPSPAASSTATSTTTSSASATDTTGTGALPQLSRGDDVLVTLSYNLLTRRFGRDINKPLFDSILLALVSKTAPTTAAVPVTSYDTPFVQLIPDAAARVTAMAEYETAAIAAMPDVAKQLGTDLGELANRQPQIFASGLYQRRAPQIGPDLHGFRLTWEIGNDNLNSFRDQGGRDCETRGDCLAAFTDFTARNAKRHRTGRLALAIQYGKTALNNEGKFTEVATQYLTYMATYGQQISSFTAQPTRIDLSYTYDGKRWTKGFTTGGTGATSRRVSTFAAPVDQTVIPPSSIHDALGFTVTQSIGRNLTVPVSVVRSNHDDWTPGTNCVIAAPPNSVSSPVVIVPSPPCTPPAHRRHGETEYRLGLRIQLPSFSRPPQNPSCCCK